MPKEAKVPNTEEKKPEELVEFLVKVGKLGYPLADVTGKMVVVSRNEDDGMLSIGFQDSNGRKQIVMTATRDFWKKSAADLIEYIAEKEKA